MSNRKNIIVRVVVMTLLVIPVVATIASGKIIYVDDDASGANDGTSWENAYVYLQDALADANESEKPVEIRVAQGIYKPDQGANQTPGDQGATFQLVNDVILKGGFVGIGDLDPDLRDVEVYRTILSGDLLGNDIEVAKPSDLEDEPTNEENSDCVVIGNGINETAVLDGFIITGGGGMENKSGSPTLVNCTFYWNCSGMSNDIESDPILINCAFLNNWARYGGGMENSGNPMLINCTFRGNIATNNGGGIDNSGSPTLINCIFTENTGCGGGMNNEDGSPTLINCTFTRNLADDYGGGMCNEYNSIPTLINCILWNNTPDEVYLGGDASATITYSDVQGGWPGEGNIDADPLFDDDLRLLGNSPCIDAGNNSAIPTSVVTDYDGNPRIINGKVDMGAYESPTANFILSTSSLVIPEGQTATFTVALTEPPLETIDVTVAHHAGDRDINIESGGLLTFSAQDYMEPQKVTLIADEDSDYLDGTARIRISAHGFAVVKLVVREWDNEALYVDADATGANNGSSWADAFVNLQDALSLARVNLENHRIRVAQGVYKPDQGANQTPGDRNATFKLIDGVTLKGGFAGFGEPDPNSRDIDLYETILSGDLLGNDIEDPIAKNDPFGRWWDEPPFNDNSSHVVTSYKDNPTAVLDGLTITGSSSTGLQNGSVFFEGSSITLLNCTITRNIGGMSNSQADPTLINCTFRGNSAAVGGGMWNAWGDPTLINCTFSDNYAIYHGAGSPRGGGMSNMRGNPTLINCVFFRNLAESYGGAIYNMGNPTLVNCTFTANDVSASWRFDGDVGGAIYNRGKVTLTNCILWGNRPNEISQDSIEDLFLISYSNIKGGWWDQRRQIGNIDADPLFVDRFGHDNVPGAEDYDLRLAPLSPCVDSGDPDYVPGPNETDLAGNSRLRFGRIDMGAYEFQCIIYVDDDAPEDPGPGDILVSDPRENGAESHPMDNIQEAIDIAKDGYTILVNGGVYSEPVDFKGKAITVTSGSDVAVLEAPGDYAVSFYSAEGPDSILKNFVIRNSVAGVFIPGSSPTIRNLTVVDNEYGITAYTWAEPDISNCIFFNNSEADLFQCEARYSCIEDGSQGIGNISADPLFIDAANGDYHLRSEGWCWSTLTESWTYDYVTSPCIDAGDPACPLGDEPMSVPRDPDNIYGENLRINMGAYGGTSQASMPPVGWTPP